MNETENEPIDIRSSIEAAYEEITAKGSHDLPLPEETLDAPREDRHRDNQGRFASKDSNENAKAAEPAEPAASVEAKPAPMGKLDANAGSSEAADQTPAGGSADRSAPPHRVGAATKAAWNELPEAIRNEIWDREERMDRGMARYAGLAEFAVEAEKNGRSLKEVMQAYTQAEENLVSNPIATLAEFCKMTNTNPLAVAQFLGVPIGVQPPSMPQSAPQGQMPVLPDPRVDELLRWKQELSRQEAARHFAQINSEVDTFLSDTKRFPYAENVRVTMGKLLDAGMATSLEDAYSQAIYLDPTVRQLVEEDAFKNRMAAVQQSNKAQSNRAAVASAKQSAGSLSGSPVAGGRSVQNSGPKSVADSIREAYDSLAG